MADYQINFENFEVHECGAVLVSLLAYPNDDKDERQRENLHASLCAFLLRAKFDDSEHENTPQPMKPIHAFRERHQINRDLKTLKRRMRDRMVAARMAIPFLQEVETGSPPPLPASIKRLSINAMAEFVLDDAGQSDPENVETRIWRPSLPVIHLAAATQVFLNLAETDNRGPLLLGDILCSRFAIEYIVTEAQRYEALLFKGLTQKAIAPEKLIKLRLA